MASVPDLISLARRIDAFADEAEARGNEARAAELRELAAALRAKLAERLRAGRSVRASSRPVDQPTLTPVGSLGERDVVGDR